MVEGALDAMFGGAGRSRTMTNAQMRTRTSAGGVMVTVALGWLAAAGPASAVNGKVTRFRNDGTGMFRDALPVTAWDERTGSNIVWKTKLPRWSNSSPIMTQGRVFVMAEPVAGFPILSCLHAGTGEILWQREVDHLDCLPPVRQREARAHWRKVFAAHPQYRKWSKRAEQKLKGAPIDSEKAKLLAEEGEDEGYVLSYDKRRKGWRVEWPALSKEARKYGGGFPQWWPGKGYGGRWLGFAYPTPVADGECVYVAVSFNAVACFDFEGRRRWVNWAGPDCTHRGCMHAPSPILAGDYVVVQASDRVRALDKRTGVEIWSAKANPNKEVGGGRTKVGTPVYLECGLIVATDGWVYRLTDGELLARDAVAAMLYDTLTVDTARNTVYAQLTWRKPGYSAVRFGLDTDGELVREQLWHTEGKGAARGMSLVYDGERLYSVSHVLDAATGRIVGEFPFDVKGGDGNFTGGGGYLFVRKGRSPGFSVFTTEREPKLVSKPFSAPNMSNPCFDGPRMFVRTHDHLCAVGDPGVPYETSLLIVSPTAGRTFPGTQPPVQWMADNFLWCAGTGRLEEARRAGPPAWSAGRLVGMTTEDTLTAWDAESGALLWQSGPDGDTEGAAERPAPAERVVTRPCVAVRDRSVFAVFGDGRIGRFGIEGDRRWVCRPEPSDGKTANDVTPIPSEKRVAVQLGDLVSLDIETGAERWRVSVPAAGPLAAPVLCRLRHGALALLTADGRLLRESDGASIAIGLPATGRSAPVVNHGVAYLCASREPGGKATVAALRLPAADATSQTCRVLWEVDADGVSGFAAIPLVHDGLLYVFSDDGTLLAFETETGKLCGKRALASAATAKVGRAPSDFPALALAGGRLYVPLGGEPGITAVMEPGRDCREIWRYAVSCQSGDPVFRGDRQYMSTGGRLVCIGGPTPVEPVRPPFTVLEPDEGFELPTGATVTPFRDQQMPDAWLYCGPFKGRSLETDFLACLGGRLGARPASGTLVTHADTNHTFRAVASKHLWSHWRFTSDMKALDFKSAVSNAFDCTTYYHTVISNDRPRYVRFRFLTPGGEDWNDKERLLAVTWLAGRPLNEKPVYRLAPGHYPLLMQVSIGRTRKNGGKIWAAPRFIDVTAEHEQRERDYETRRRQWQEYQAIRHKTPLLSAEGIRRLDSR